MILDVVSTCPVCAAPIYGPKQVDNVGLPARASGQPVPLALFSCDCRQYLVHRLQLDNARVMADARKAAGAAAGG